MTIDRARKLLGGQALDFAASVGESIEVTFGRWPGDELGAVAIRIRADGFGYTVASSATAQTATFLGTADAYARAASFIRKAGLMPA